MAGWSIAAAAAGLWTGIVLAGLRSGPPPAGQGAALLALGAAGLWAAFLARHLRLHRLVAAGVAAAGVSVPFLFLGAGWAEVQQGHVAASPLALLAGRSVQVSGTLGDAPQAGHLGWTASMRVDVLAPFAPGWPDRVRLHDPVWLEGHGAPPRVAGGGRRGR